MRTLARGLVTALIATLLAVGISPLPAQAGPDYQRPSVGECRNIAFFSGYSGVGPLVDCTGAHTTLTIAVGRYPKRFRDLGTRRLWTKVQKRSFPACADAYRATLDVVATKRARSAYTFVPLIPTREQRAAGARWFRCDLTMRSGDQQLVLLKTAENMLTGRLGQDEKLCLQRETLLLTVCTVRSSWGASSAFTFRGVSRYPSSRMWRTRALARCKTTFETPRFRYLVPSELAWNNGLRHAVCFGK